MCSKLSVVAVKYLKREGRVLAWQHCLTHICQGRCNYLAEAIGHRKNVIRSKIVPSCPQLPGQRFLDKSRSAVWLEELTLSCLGLSKISFKYSFDLVCSGYELQIIFGESIFSCLHDEMSGYEKWIVCLFEVSLSNVFQKSLLDIWDQPRTTAGTRTQISVSKMGFWERSFSTEHCPLLHLHRKVEGTPARLGLKGSDVVKLEGEQNMVATGLLQGLR